MNKGTYVLLMRNDRCSLKTGALGIIHYKAGWHTYVGSALGPGGFSRAERHTRINREKNKKPRWHIDFLLLSPFFQISQVLCIQSEERMECLVSHQMDGQVITGFGSSDCKCPGHLFYYPTDPFHHILHTFESFFEQKGISADMYLLHSG
jgi:Uri superfamily endonuclease